jgi:hypothetical protein
MLKLYWVGDRGFLEVDGKEYEGIAKVKHEKGKLEVCFLSKIRY